jgi:N-acyl-D-amino-acid deacylase
MTSRANDWPILRNGFLRLLLPCALRMLSGDRSITAAEPQSPAQASAVDAKSDTERAIAARELALPIVHKAVANYPAHRKCFACHHQTLPMLAILAAGGTPSAADLATVTAAAEHTHKSFTGQLEQLNKGEGIGGRALTVSYGLWALKLADWKPDETTAAMVAYLLKTQEDDGHWDVHTSRPPMEDSSETSTALAIAGLLAYATADQKETSDVAIAKAKTWIAGCAPKTQEDRASRLWALHLLSATGDELNAARNAVLAAQREDGGWSQLDDMESDAYATGHTLYVLGLAGVPAMSPAYQRGVEYLLKTQRDDGSWFVKSRSKPVQVYFDNGDPHGRDQFISTPATCWALVALARGCEPPKQTPAD